MTWWGRLFKRGRTERQLDAKLRDHCERQVADYIDEGMSETDARRRARVEFGGLDQIKELCRDARGTRLVEDTARDIAYAARVLRRSPGFTAIAVLTLALGIGANVSVFSLLDALLLRPLPVQHASELIAIWRVPHSEHFSFPQVQELAAARHLFTSLCAFGNDVINVGPPEAVAATGGLWVTGNFYEVLGLVPAAGRLLRPDDDRAGAAPVAVISHAYWTRHFNRDPSVIGGALQLDGVPVTVIGVAPERFLGPVVGEAADVTLPVNVRPQLQPARGYLDDSSRWLRVLARPQPDVPAEQVASQLTAIWSRRMQATLSPTVAADVRARMLASTLEVVPGATGASSLRAPFRAPLFVAMTLVSLVLLIACVNVAHLLLARSTTRRREMSLRLAIGAGRGRLVRQLLTESVLVAAIGAALGGLIGTVGSRGLLALMAMAPGGPDSLGVVVLELSFDWRMFVFATVMVGVTTILCGIAPALRAANTAPIVALTTRTGDARRHVATALVVAQVALSLLVLVGAGLFVRTLYNLRTVDRGFRHEGVLVVEVDGARAGFKGDALGVFNRELLGFGERTRGVRVATLASMTPLRGGGISVPMTVNGRPAGDGEVYYNNVGPRYFEALGTRLVAGREFVSADDRVATPVAIVNEAFARAYMNDDDPLGQRVAVAKSDIERLVVGVVRDAAYETLRAAPPPTVYVPFLQSGGEHGGDIGATLVLFAPGAVDQVAAQIREYVQPRLGGRPPRIRTLTAQVDRSLARERLLATIASVFGALVLALAAIGIYGLLAYLVAGRTHEIGVRLALGAARWSVLRLVVGDALRMVTLGAAIGLLAALGVTRAISALLFGLTPTDASTLLAAVLVLVIAGLLAAVLPATRAARVDPTTALRDE